MGIERDRRGASCKIAGIVYKGSRMTWCALATSTVLASLLVAVTSWAQVASRLAWSNSSGIHPSSGEQVGLAQVHRLGWRMVVAMAYWAGVS